MGHIRLGTIPTSQPWRNVVAAMLAPADTRLGVESERRQSDAAVGHGGGAAGGHLGANDSESKEPSSYSRSIAAIAAKTLFAAKGALRDAKSDEGLRFTFYLLSQVALASRSPDWIARLAADGMVVRPTDSLAELTVAFQAAVDQRLERREATSDLAELAQRAAGHALCQLTADKADTLFGNTGDDLRHAVRTLSSPQGFGRLSQSFFGSFLSQFLNFYLSRVTASELGRGSVGEIGDITAFNQALARHCDQSAAIVKNFAAEWYSKTEFQYGIDARRAGSFVAIAINKLQAELDAQGRG